MLKGFLRIADDLGGAYVGWFVDCCDMKVSEVVVGVGVGTLRYRRRLRGCGVSLRTFCG